MDQPLYLQDMGAMLALIVRSSRSEGGKFTGEYLIALLGHHLLAFPTSSVVLFTSHIYAIL